MPQLSKRRKRPTETASEKDIAEADGVWHSTAISDSRFAIDELRESNAENDAPGRSSKNDYLGKKSTVSTVTATKNGSTRPSDKDSGRGISASRDSFDESRINLSPIVINPPSGHAFFSSVLQKSGYVIRQPNASNEMFFDVMAFRKKLADWLKDNDDEMRRIETETSKFYTAINAYLAEKPNFIDSMKPTKHETELIQPSLLHCLLGIDAMQTRILRIIMPLLGEACFSNTEEDVALVNTILNQLKWLPSITEGDKFLENLLSIVDTAAIQNQNQIVKLLPDILPSHLHSKVAEKLLEKFSQEDLHLNIALMDCFSSLDIPDGHWCNIRTAAVDQMSSACLRDMPAYFAFLFRAETIHSLTEVISTMREKIDLLPDARSSSNDAYQIEILEKISFCITVNPAIVNIWIKQVKDDLQQEVLDGIKVIDLIMLLIFADTHKAAVSMIKLVFAEKKLSLRLFTKMMKNNTPMVYQLFSTITKIIDSLLRARDAKCLETICEITVQLFVGLSALEAQTLMGNMTGILVNFPPSRDAVLKILSKLAETEPKKLLLFAPYLMGVLEYVMQFPARQIRALMNVLAILSQTDGRNPGDSNHFNAEFSILLRKQLTHSDLKIRCFGVFGALASIRHMCQKQIVDTVRTKELLKLAWNFVERDENACCIFFDELTQCVEFLPEDICKVFRQILKTKFQNLWTEEETTGEAKFRTFTERAALNLKTEYDANKECSQDQLIIIFESQPMEMSPFVIPSHLRVLATLERKVDEGDLTGIDVILGCPILFPSKEYYLRDSLDDLTYNQRYNLGQYLVLAINFFRESVCAFVGCDDPELKIKVWLRLNNILELQKLLVKHFDSFISLPLAYAAEKTLASTRDGAGPSGVNNYVIPSKGFCTRPGAVINRKKKRPKKKARVENDVNLESEEEEEQQPVLKKPVPRANFDDEIQPKKCLTFLRRFDGRVFKLLQSPLTCEATEDVDFCNILANLTTASQNPGVLIKVQTFSCDTLILLLTELKHQLSDDRIQLSVFSIKWLLRSVCEHLNTILCSIAENEANDDSFNGSEQRAKIECCLRLLINTLVLYFDSMRKLDKEEKDKQIERAVHILARQANTTQESTDLSSQAEVMSSVATYLGGLSSAVSDPNTALDHMKLLKNVHDLLSGVAELKKVIDTTAQSYLKTQWKTSSNVVDGILKVWLGTTPSSMKAIKLLASKILHYEDEEDDVIRLPNCATYKACSNSNFHVWYNAMMLGLSQYVNKNLKRRGDFEDSINEWIDAIQVFKDLVEAAQKESKNLILISLLKNCRPFLDAFISGGAELLPEFFKRNKNEAQRFCKALQVPCRTIQHICEHSKKNTDLQMLRSVPVVKKALETLVFRVREVLTVNGAACAFWMGSLKHRDLKGDCMTSQILAPDELSFSSDEDEFDDVSAAVLSAESMRPGSPLEEEAVGGETVGDYSNSDSEML